ncbi:MAG: YqaJ viral recombinase family protein [Herbinix sp.]|nr:YqaJ viral recombinase family protein [Herbinix sp.]
MSNILVATKDLDYQTWLEYRNKGIGGSDVSILCGINKFKSIMQLWMEKSGMMPLQPTDSEVAYWGTVLEPIVKKEFTNRTGLKVRERKVMMQHPKYDFMLANVDGIVKDPKNGTCIFEAKTASTYKSEQWKYGVPPEYQLQVQHYMAVTGYKKAYVAVLIGGNHFLYYEVQRDEGLIQPIIQIEKNFWNCVKNRIPPDIDGSDASTEYLNSIFSKSRNVSIQLPIDTLDLVREYEETNERIKDLTNRKNEMANKMKVLLGENEEGVVGDRKIKWISVGSERLNTRKLKEEQPEIYDKYSNTIAYRRFSVV